MGNFLPEPSQIPSRIYDCPESEIGLIIFPTAPVEARWAGQNRREQKGVGRVALKSAMEPRQIGVSLNKDTKKFGLEKPPSYLRRGFQGDGWLTLASPARLRPSLVGAGNSFLLPRLPATIFLAQSLLPQGTATNIPRRLKEKKNYSWSPPPEEDKLQ